MIVDAIFFDLTKAFDKVPHGMFVQRLYECGIRGALLDWVHDFLSNRYQSNTYTDTVVAKAFTNLGVINKVFSCKSCKVNFDPVWSAFVRPTVEYAFIVWSLYTKIRS